MSGGFQTTVMETNKHRSLDNVMCFHGLTPDILNVHTHVYADKYSSHATLCRAL